VENAKSVPKLSNTQENATLVHGRLPSVVYAFEVGHKVFYEHGLLTNGTYF